MYKLLPPRMMINKSLIQFHAVPKTLASSQFVNDFGCTKAEGKRRLKTLLLPMSFSEQTTFYLMTFQKNRSSDGAKGCTFIEF